MTIVCSGLASAEAQAKHGFEAGVVAGGECRRVADPQLETVEFYKVSGIEVHERPDAKMLAPGPRWHGAPPDLPTYRERGHRRLAAVTNEKKCTTCLWDCQMAPGTGSDRARVPSAEEEKPRRCGAPRA